MDTSFCFFAYSVAHLLSWFPSLLQGLFCLKDGLKCSLPSLQFILPATWPEHIPWASGCSAPCHGYYYFLHLPKYLSRASPFFWGKQCPAFPMGSWRPSGASAEISVTGAISPLGWGFNPLSYHYCIKKILIIFLILSLLYWGYRALYHVLSSGIEASCTLSRWLCLCVLQGLWIIYNLFIYTGVYCVTVSALRHTYFLMLHFSVPFPSIFFQAILNSFPGNLIFLA